MRITLVGSRHFGVTTFDMLRNHGVEIVRVVVADADDRLAAAARAAGVDVTLEIWAEMPHVWHAFAGLLPEADQAVERIGRWLREDRPPGDGA